jgi:hypothetical protein
VSVILVTYDLKTPGRVYTQFYETLKAQGNWWHYLSTTWLLHTQKTPNQIYTALAEHLTVKDWVLVLPVTKPAFGYLPKDAWDWINARLI